MLTAKLFFGLTVPLSLSGYLLVRSFVGASPFLSLPVWLVVFIGLSAVSVLVLMNKAENREEKIVESYKK